MVAGIVVGEVMGRRVCWEGCYCVGRDINLYGTVVMKSLD